MPKIEEVKPPWIMYPGYPPADGFWRQGGEIWFHHVWRPYWDALLPEEQKKYLKLWKVPHDWQNFYFNADFQKWLEAVDKDID